MSRSASVVIVGGGAAGTLAALHLAASPSDSPRDITIVESAPELGMGAAYGTRSPSHLLNVRAGGMSAFPETPGHFLDWLSAVGITATGTDFLPRMHYGRYLRETLGSAVDAAAGRVRLTHDRARAIHLQDMGDGAAVGLDDGRVVQAERVVLATGNVVPRRATATLAPGVVEDPWAGQALSVIEPAASVVIVGTGLTAVDVVLSLRDQGHRGTIRMLSSRGLLPEAHVDQVLGPRPPAASPGGPGSASPLALLRALRSDAALADDWRQTVDGLRPATVGLWRGLGHRERRQVMRHLGRRWEVRRHRMAPQVAEVLAAMRREGRLSVGRGRVVGVEGGSPVRATVLDRGIRSTIETDTLVMCVGPSPDPLHDPLLARSIEDGLVARHPLGVGLDVDSAGRPRRADGRIVPWLWTVGALRKGAEWESTAVPELRLHARNLAVAIDAG